MLNVQTYTRVVGGCALFLVVAVGFSLGRTQGQVPTHTKKTNASIPKKMATVPADQLKAFQVAWQHQLSLPGIPNELQDIRNYEVKLGQDSKYFYVYLMPNLPEGPRKIVNGVERIHVGATPFSGCYFLRRVDYSIGGIIMQR
jgi:hypothetical protein